jgi:sialate O-acetylesterase
MYKTYLYLLITSITLLINSCKQQSLELSLAPIFSDHMVLQQQTKVAFWGKSKPNEKVIVRGSWGESSSVITDSDGFWELYLLTPKAGGPFDVQVKNKNNSILLSDILIGEVWLVSGQSNMDWKLNQCNNCINNQDQEIKNANYNEIRFFNHPQDLSGKIVNNQKWKIVTPENASKKADFHGVESFSAAGYFFARELHKELNVPIGIIGAYWGGTRVEAWTSRKKLTELTSFKLPSINKKEVSMKDHKGIINSYKKINDSVAKLNELEFGFKTFNLTLKPDQKPDLESWKNLDLNDKEYSNINFDDSHWQNWEKKYDDVSYASLSSRFENIFDPEDFLLTNGTIWLRTKINIQDINSDFELIYEDGADDSDQTYFNGKLIGNTISWSKERRYIIEKSNLKIGENILAIRLTDLDGPGGFNGKIILKNAKIKFEIPIDQFKFIHHAFFINGQFIVHGYNHEELLDISKFLKENIHRGVIYGGANEYSILYDRILRNIIPFTLKGALWYQGEANTRNFEDYQTLFSGMIDDWREAWGYNFPFYYAQLAPFPEAGTLGVREAQRKTLLTTTNTGMAVLMDIGEKDDIHPHNKQDVGKRFSLLALNKQYGFDYTSSGPVYKSHQTNGNYLTVDFSSKGSGLEFKGDNHDFEIAGEDNEFYDAHAKIINNKLRLYSKNVINPIHVRYGWKNWTVGTLVNKEGLPASSFTTID